MSENAQSIIRRINAAIALDGYRTTRRRVRVRKNTKRKMLKHYTLRGYDFMNKAQNEIFLGLSDITDLFQSKILEARNSANLETFTRDFGIYCTHKEWVEFLPVLQHDLRIVQVGRDTGYLFDDVGMNWLQYRIHSTHINITLTGDKEFGDEYQSLFTENFQFVTNHIEWLYSNDGASIEIPLQHERMPVEEMYPFLNGQSLADYYDDFMKSNASILLLIGPPGTGKTTFIRGMLQHTESSAIVSYDAAVLEKDYVFAQFIEGDKSMMVLEDADMFLKARKEGNTMMHKFLNVGDGLVTTRNKKLIFSTNLPSINDIDPALVRPGRCYDIVHFKELNQEQAEKLAVKVGTKLNGQRDKWSIADIFFEKEKRNTRELKNSIERKMGFV
jgi:hypothetical protein